MDFGFEEFGVLGFRMFGIFGFWISDVRSLLCLFEFLIWRVCSLTSHEFWKFLDLGFPFFFEFEDLRFRI